MHDYSPVGKLSSLGDLPIYESGAGPYGVIIIPDIFGFSYTQVHWSRVGRPALASAMMF